MIDSDHNRRGGDYAYAAPFLRELGPQYAAHQWHDLEVAVLDMYVFCLRKLNKVVEYIPAALNMLAKTARMQEMASMTHRAVFKNDSAPSSKVSLANIIEASAALNQAIQVPLADYFDEVNLSKNIEHSESNDSYSFPLKFRCRLASNVPIDNVLVRLTSTGDGPSRDISFSSTQALHATAGTNTVNVQSQVSSQLGHPTCLTTSDYGTGLVYVG